MNDHDVDNNLELVDDDDDAENMISLDKIKSSVSLNRDHRNVSCFIPQGVVKETRKLSPEMNLQEAFQPSSTPVHLFSRYMVRIKNRKYKLEQMFLNSSAFYIIEDTFSK